MNYTYLTNICYRLISGNCSEGFFCNTTSDTPTQYVCPQGHYCPIGTGVPIPCPAGTYTDQDMNNEVADCTSCTPGKYCQGRFC